MPFPLFDAHCDTIIKIVDAGVDIFQPPTGKEGGADGQRNPTHVDVPGLLEAGFGCQVFACFASKMQFGERSPQRSRELIAAVRALEGKGPLKIPGTAEELESLGRQQGPERNIGVLLAVEGGEALGGRPEAVAEFAGLGVRYITLAWGDNELTGSSFGAGHGLTDLGREVVAEMERHKVLVDVSHMSDQAFSDLERMASRPFIASHSNCRSLCGAQRNMTDAQIQAVARSGGVVGVNFASGLLTHEANQIQAPIFQRILSRVQDEPERLEELLEAVAKEVGGTPLPPFDAVADHLDHIVQLGGIEAAGFGADLDGISHGPKGMKGCRDFSLVLALLRQRGYSEEDLRRICWENWLRVFCTTFVQGG